MIKVLQPSMPTADDLLPFLREIDAARVYVNNGPLVQRLAKALGALIGAPCALVSNGTLAIELALRALRLPRHSGVLVPAVTFIGTAQAIVNAGLRPVVCDVDPLSWQMTTAEAADRLQRHPSIRAIVPVAAFGLPVPVAPWSLFAEASGMSVVIDAAGAVYGQEPPKTEAVSVCYSMHATKALGAGEGGAIASPSSALLEHVASLACFGPGGTNAKMSEYHAAVALASLSRDGDGHKWRSNVLAWYALHCRVPLEFQTGFQARRTLLPALLPEGNHAQAIADALLDHRGIETKRWYAPYLHERAPFITADDLPVADRLSDRLLGLPFHEFLSEADVMTVCDALAEVVR